MEKRAWWILSALVLTITGAFFLSLPSITGAFAVESFEGTSIFGAILLLVSVILLVTVEGLEKEAESEFAKQPKLVSAEDFAVRIESMESDAAKRIIVLDTSAILDYGTKIEKMLMQYRGKVFVPNEVLKEIKDQGLRARVEQNSINSSTQIPGQAYETLKKEAKEILESTEKGRMYANLEPILVKLIDGKLISHGDVDTVKNGVRLLRSHMTQHTEYGELKETILKGKLIPGKKLYETMRNYLNRHCKVKDADVEVLATALYWARKGSHVVIGERDIDFEQAIEKIKEKDKRIAKNLDYVSSYAA